MVKLLLSTMGTDYFYLFDDAEEADRVAFIASEMESLKQLAPLYDGVEFSASSYEDDSALEDI
jgi:hypothetical protein